MNLITILAFIIVCGPTALMFWAFTDFRTEEEKAQDNKFDPERAELIQKRIMRELIEKRIHDKHMGIAKEAISLDLEKLHKIPDFDY